MPRLTAPAPRLTTWSRAIILFLPLALPFTGACAPGGVSGGPGDDAGTAGSTGVPGSGGNAVQGSGGASSSGGAPATGGAPGSGGRAGAGGVAAGSGGAAATGGATGSGGRAAGGAAASGGATATGGRGAGGATGTGGTAASGGTTGTGGRGTGGATATGGATGTGGAPTGTCVAPVWPTPVGTEKVFSSTQRVTKAAPYDGKLALHNGTGSNLGIDCSSSNEQSSVVPLFDLEDGATIRNVIFGKFAADGIHCLGSCTIENVWWTDLCDDAATFLGTAADTRVVVNGGGARAGADKTLQHNGAGTVTINNFFVQEVGKMYRSCGTCSPQYARHVEINNPTAITIRSDLIGVNRNHGDTAVFTGTICVRGVSNICTRYDDTTRVASGSDGTTCTYTQSSVKTF